MGVWDRRAIAEVDCPRCGATKGSPCRTASGRRSSSPHGPRYAKAMNRYRAGEGSETSQ